MVPRRALFSPSVTAERGLLPCSRDMARNQGGRFVGTDRSMAGRVMHPSRVLHHWRRTHPTGFPRFHARRLRAMCDTCSPTPLPIRLGRKSTALASAILVT